MSVFTYKAIKDGSNFVKGSIEATSIKEVRDMLRKMDLVPVKIEEGQSNSNASSMFNSNRSKLKRLSMREKIDFTNTMHILSKSGVSIIESLMFMETNAATPNSGKLAEELRKSVLAGANLSEAITKFPFIFDQVFIGLIKAGEESGEIDTTLGRMVFLLKKQEKLRGKIIATMVYPTMVIILAMAVTLIMLMVVFPAFKDVFATSGKKLPFITQFLIDLGDFLKTFWIVVPITIGSMVYVALNIMKWRFTKRLIDRGLLKLPILSDFVKYASLSNFISVLKVAFDAGVPIVDSLILSNLTVSNTVLNQAVRNSATSIQNGQSLSNSLKSTEFMPPIIMCMISTGEQSGNLGEMLDQAGAYIDDELERVVDLLNKASEPFLLVVIGSIVLVLALALYLPLFQSYANMSG
ncbi:MAG: type II secretion system F family protein [bacterium]